MPRNYMSKMVIPVKVGDVVTDTEFYVKDEEARQMIEDLGRALYWIGVTTTPITEGATTSPVVIPGKYEEVTPVGSENPSELGWYEYDETQETYVLTADVTVDASKTYFTTSIVPKVGGVVQYVNGTEPLEFVWNGSSWQQFGYSNLGALAFKSSASTAEPYEPVGTVSSNNDAGTTSVFSITDEGALPYFTVSGEVATFHPGTLPTKGSEQTVLTDVGTFDFQGTAQTITVQ